MRSKCWMFILLLSACQQDHCIIRSEDESVLPGVWRIAAPGMVGFVFPADGYVYAPMTCNAELMITDILMAEHVLQSQMVLLDLHTTYPLPPVRWKLHGYTRQYKGYWDTDGNLHIYINAIWQEEHGGKGFYLVHDGGNFYWQAWVDVKNKRLYDLMINGEA